MNSSYRWLRLRRHVVRRDQNALKFIRQFAERGIPVLPFLAKSKRPAVKNGLYDATTDMVALKQIFSEAPAREFRSQNWLPVRHFCARHRWTVGKRSLLKLIKKHGPLPKTVTVQTANGEHRYFRCEERVIRNSAGRIGEGLDIRGDGGYVVGPGSIHPSGTKYRFKVGRSLEDRHIARPPAWLLDLIVQKNLSSAATDSTAVGSKVSARVQAYVTAAFERELDRLERAPNHQRNHCLNRCAFKLGQLLPYSTMTAEDCSRRLAEIAKRIGLDDSEIAPTIRSGLTAGCQNPRPLNFLKGGSSATAITKDDGRGTMDLSAELSKLQETIRTMPDASRRASSTRPARGGLYMTARVGNPTVSCNVWSLRRRQPASSQRRPCI